MNFVHFLEGLALCVPMAAIIFGVLKWVSNQPNLLVEMNPNTGQIGPVYTCRGGWNEGELRGCNGGYTNTGIPVEPINTYSNLAYLVAGWMVFRHVGGGSAIVFCCAMAFLCFGSALYHGIKARWSARWDHGGMYAVVAGLTFYVIVAGHAWEVWIVLAGSVMSGVVLAWLLDGFLLTRVGILMALITAGVMTSGDVTLGLYSLGFFALAMVIWIIDKNTTAFGRVGHGIWHVFTAVGLALMFVAV